MEGHQRSLFHSGAHPDGLGVDENGEHGYHLVDPRFLQGFPSTASQSEADRRRYLQDDQSKYGERPRNFQQPSSSDRNHLNTGRDAHLYHSHGAPNQIGNGASYHQGNFSYSQYHPARNNSAAWGFQNQHFSGLSQFEYDQQGYYNNFQQPRHPHLQSHTQGSLDFYPQYTTGMDATREASSAPSPMSELTDDSTVNAHTMQVPSQAGSSSPSQAVHDDNIRAHNKEMIKQFRDAPKVYRGLMDAAGDFIPQTVYRPHTEKDQDRYVNACRLENVIEFWTSSATGTGKQLGIPMMDALNGRTGQLMDSDLQVWDGCGPSVSVRIGWKGYRPWSRQIPTKNFKKHPDPITKAKLAKAVAKCVEKFVNKDHRPSDDDELSFVIGRGSDQIKLEDLVLVSIHHTSKGSWQPHLRLRRPATGPSSQG